MRVCACACANRQQCITQSHKKGMETFYFYTRSSISCDDETRRMNLKKTRNPQTREAKRRQTKEKRKRKRRRKSSETRVGTRDKKKRDTHTNWKKQKREERDTQTNRKHREKKNKRGKKEEKKRNIVIIIIRLRSKEGEKECWSAFLFSLFFSLFIREEERDATAPRCWLLFITIYRFERVRFYSIYSIKSRARERV